MRTAIEAVAITAGAINLAAALLGGWRWWQVEPSRSFWPLLRAGQIAAVLFAVFCAVLAALGEAPKGGLFWLYVLLPLGVAFVAEQLRVSSAQAVLDARGLDDAQAVGRLPEPDQRSVVLQIVRREMGVMAAEAAVVCFLLVRAVTTA
jgi:hypothetical protein